MIQVNHVISSSTVVVKKHKLAVTLFFITLRLYIRNCIFSGHFIRTYCTFIRALVHTRQKPTLL